MDKINLQEYYIEEHVYKGDYYNPNFIITVAVAELSKRLVYLSRNGYTIGKYKKADQTHREPPKSLSQLEYTTNFHFLIAIRKNFSIDNSKTKLIILKLLNKKGFKKEIANLNHLIHSGEKYYQEFRKLAFELLKSDLNPRDNKNFEAIKKDRGFNSKELEKQFLYSVYIDHLKRKFKIPDQYNFVLETIIEKGFDYTIDFIDTLTLNNLAYLDYYNCIPYFIPSHNYLGCKYAQQPEHKNIIKSLPIVYYFSQKYLKDTVTDLPAINYESYYSVYRLTKQKPGLTDKEIAEQLLGACGKKEVDRIKQTRARLRHLLA